MKTKRIIDRVLTGLIAIIFIGSAFMKFFGSDEALKTAINLGITPSTYIVIGIIEIICIILFLIPRTGIIGILLLIAYMGGAIATHLSHGVSFVEPVVISALVWIVAFVRYSELSQRLFGKV
ncbi:MAG: DoxX family protein [Bacteroidetes bacterium]|jgi:uncharacterized membrane protein YphA (DoxX/SURF4 family)|nr:MAG: DoxX family protein [Bacteroidota bacterium]